jgi:hypothetical protein
MYNFYYPYKGQHMKYKTDYYESMRGEDGRFHFIYKMTNIINKKYYIGAHSTYDLGDGYKGSGTILNNAYKKYGKKSFKRDILQFYKNRDELFKAEKIDQAYSARNTLNEAFNLDFDKAEDDKEKLDESVKLSLHSATDRYSYYVEAVDDPGTMFELTKFGKTYGYIETPNEESQLDNISAFTGISASGTYNFRMKSTDVNVYQADDFVHACLS